MEEGKLRNLLDKIYELEGLVYLSLHRDERYEDLLRIISNKANEISELCGEYKNMVSDRKVEYVKFTDQYTLEDESKFDFKENKIDNSEDSLSDLSRGRLVFSINDRYRFKKNLFNGSDLEFNNTLALVASMENYEEAEEYFINEQGWSLSESNVVDFLDVIKKYFNE